MALSIVSLSNELSIIIDLSLTFLAVCFLIFFSIKNKMSTRLLIGSCSFVVLFVVSSIIFELPSFSNSLIVIAFVMVIYIALLLTDKEKQHILRHNKKLSNKENSLTINETDELLKNLQIAIESLSATRTGALITIERQDDLSEIVEKTGTPVNALVTPELLGTIFYKGTPLHDGATIIRGNMVVTSAVFYQPTQKALNGKYGSRHRAAMGISEICDAITIVVSEETGKVSIAYKGELTSIPVASFSKKLKELYLSQN